MIVMPANVTSPEVRQLLHDFPGLVGNLFSPGAWRTPIGVYALDNGRFSSRGSEWSQREYLELLRRASLHHRAPAWCLAPDVVGDWPGTMRDWARWESRLRSTGWPVAVAVQDGATVQDVSAMCPNVVFVGGSTGWKWKTVETWAKEFPRVHVGRVNSMRKAFELHLLGVESVDGTGWMRTTRQRKQLRTLLGQMRGSVSAPILLFHNDLHMGGRCDL